MRKNISHIPMFVDRTGEGEEGMVRLAYFYIECVEPHDSALVIEEELLPILLIDLEGVVVTGFGEGMLLDSPELISELFDYIHDKLPFVISTNYIWLPNKLLSTFIDKLLKRGDVLRVSREIFIYASKQIKNPEAMDFHDIPMDRESIFFSKEETRAFKKWTIMTIEGIRERYISQPEMNLRNRSIGRER